MPDSNLTIEHIQRKYDLLLAEVSPEEALAEVAQRVCPLAGGVAAFEAWLSWREAELSQATRRTEDSAGQ